MKMNIEAQGIDKVKTLIKVLNNNIERLPEDLVNTLKQVADCKTFEYDAEYFRNKGLFPVLVHADGRRIDNVTSINQILKRVKVDSGKDVDFGFCNITCNGESVLTVGDNVMTMKVPADSRYTELTPKITNDMKGNCIGEFSWEEESPYYDENGELIECTATRIVPWDLCKDIYKKMAAIANKSIKES